MQKLCYAHFPVGTTFLVTDMIAKMYDGLKQFEVTGIVRNGATSYVLETTHTDEWTSPIYDDDGKLTDKVKVEVRHTAINICHVEKIIKRGNGPVRLREAGVPFQAHSRDTGISKGKGSYASYYGLNRIVRAIVDTCIPADACVDIERLMMFINHNAAVRVQKLPFWGGELNIFRIRKKKLRRIVRQNINRFLLSPKLVQHMNDVDDMESLNRSYDSAFDDLLPQNWPEPISAEGSCYGDEPCSVFASDFLETEAHDEQFALKAGREEGEHY